MVRSSTRRTSSNASRQASRRNIARAHMTRYRSREPRSPGRVRPVRRRSSW